MKQTENISLGGYSFTIGKDALQLLEEYIGKVEASSSSDVKDELVADIEERLAELFIDKYGKGFVIDMEAVKNVTSIVGVPETDDAEASSDNHSSSETEFPKAPHKRIYRNLGNRMLGGVFSGIASYFSLDVTFLRLLAALFAVVFFLCHFFQSLCLMVLAYVVVWVVMPAPKSVEEKCEFEGKPLKFDDFKDRAESLKDALSSSAEKLSEEVKTAPMGHTIARGIAVFVGVISTIIGIVALLIALFLVVDFPLERVDFSQFYAEHLSTLINSCLSTTSIRWALIAFVGLLGLGQLYDGVKNIFDLKSPSWRPGLIIFILWCVSIIVLVLLVTKNVLIMNNVILTV